MRITKRDPEAEEEQALIQRVGAFFVGLFKKASGTPDSEKNKKEDDKQDEAEKPDEDSDEVGSSEPDEEKPAQEEPDAEKCGGKKQTKKSAEAGDSGSDADHKQEPGLDPESTKPMVQKGLVVDMVFDTSKMSAAELQQYEDLCKRFGSEKSVNGIEAEELKKRDDAIAALTEQNKKLAESIQKMADAREADELTAVAKQYEILGKKAEELVPVFRTMKAAGEDVFKSYIDALDASKDALVKSGLFNEIGKSGTSEEASAVEKIAKIAAEIAKTEKVTMAVAKQMAWDQHPELVQQYEDEMK